MGPSEGYVVGVVAVIVAFLLSFLVYRITRSKLSGCFLQFIVFVVLFFILILGFHIINDYNGSTGSMICVEYVEEDTSCRSQRTWWIKPDKTFYFKYDIGSNGHEETPCGNDSYSERGTYMRLDSIYAIKTNEITPVTIYFDLKKQRATPIINNDTIKVISMDWNLITEFFMK